MKKGLILSVLAVFLMACGENTSPVEEPTKNTNTTELPSPEVDRKYRPFLHFFTSIHCGGCGRFGIPVSELVAEEMRDSILMLPTHFKYNDVFINNSTLAIEKGLVKTYHSPQLWVNTEEYTYSIIGMDHNSAADYLKNKLREELNNDPGAYVGLTYKMKDNGRLDVKVAVENANDTEAEYYYEVYGMQDSLNEVQAGNNPYRRDHHRVNRGGKYGEMGRMHAFEGNERIEDHFEYVPCQGCEAEKLYFYVIVWKSVGNGRFEYVNGKEFRN
ncbi:MAG: hypothetical protein JJ975_03195 [Bacteroidia bacterium]|nr:hypothetical protein [Bacteroidia bacterium]